MATQRPIPEAARDPGEGALCGSGASGAATPAELLFGSVVIPAQNFDRRRVDRLLVKFQQGTHAAGQIRHPPIRQPELSGSAEGEDCLSSHEEPRTCGSGQLLKRRQIGRGTKWLGMTPLYNQLDH